MGQIRVYELAGELGLSVSLVLDQLREWGWPEGSSDAALLTADRADRLRAMRKKDWKENRGRWQKPWSASTKPVGQDRSRSRILVERRYGSRHYLDDWPDRPPLTAVQAAKELRVRPATIRQWVSRGYLTPVGKHGRAHLYAPADLAEAARRVDENKTLVPHPASDPLLYLPLTQLVTTAEAASLARVAPSTIRMWVTRGRLEPVSPARPHRYTIGALRQAARRSPGKGIWGMWGSDDDDD